MKTWSDENIAYLKEHYRKIPNKEIARQLGKTECAVKAKAGVLGLMRSRRFTETDIAMLKAEYPDTPTDMIADKLGRTITSIYGIAGKLGITKSPEYQAEKKRKEAERLASSGSVHRYRKGHVPANKGLRRPGYAPGNMAKTQFKKGQRSHNWRPVGSERVCSKDGYILIKVSEGQPLNYRHKHVVIWEEANGPVPKDFIVAFKDGNKQNCVLENLELISRAELMQRNTIHNYPEPIKEQIHILRGFRRKLNHAKKQDRRSA